MKTALIVARYREDVSWLDLIKNEKDVFIYNKNTQLDHDEYNIKPSYVDVDGVKLCDLPNIGRESHTYLYHIVNNYDNLADVNIFLQGRPFDHCPHILNDIKQLPENVSYKPFSRYANQNRQDFLNIHNSPDVGVNFFYGTHYTLYKELFGKELPDKYAVGIHGMFAVSRELILQNSKDVYVKCLEKFNRKVYLTGFAMDSQGYDPQRLQTPEIISRYGGVPNGEGFSWMFEYFWDLLFHSQLNYHV